MEIAGTNALVVGASRGLGQGLAQALAEAGAQVRGLARSGGDLIADATDAKAASRILADVSPRLLVVSAGSPPPMGPIDRMSWEDFSANWNSDTRIALTWVQAALTMPLAPGSLVLITSSGAAVNGSPISGGYAGAKRALWFIADYAQGIADQRGLGLSFRILVPRQMVAGTGTGDAGLAAYAAAAGVSFETQATKWPEMPPLAFGRLVVEELARSGFATRAPHAVRGDTGVTVMA